MSCGEVAALNRPKISRSRSVCCAWMPAFEPVPKNLASPLCLNPRITRTSVTYNVTGNKTPNALYQPAVGPPAGYGSQAGGSCGLMCHCEHRTRAPKDDPAHLFTMQPLDQRGATTPAIQPEPHDCTLEKDGTVPGMYKYGTRVRIWFRDYRESQVLRYRWWASSHARAMTCLERAPGTTRARLCRIVLDSDDFTSMIPYTLSIGTTAVFPLKRTGALSASWMMMSAECVWSPDRAMISPLRTPYFAGRCFVGIRGESLRGCHPCLRDGR